MNSPELFQPPTSDQNTTSNPLALAAIGTSFIAIIGCTFPFVSMQLRSPLPYMATPKHKVERALKFLMDRGNIQLIENKKAHGPISLMVKSESNAITQPRFVDLGSGDGTTILAASALSWKSTGIELNPTLWAISSSRRLFQKPPIRHNSTFLHGDMFQSTRLKKELNKANCVMVFGVNSLMPKIADLIRNQCQQGVFVMSYRFRIPLLEHRVTDSDECSGVKEGANVGVIDATLIYEEEEMRVYEMGRVE